MDRVVATDPVPAELPSEHIVDVQNEGELPQNNGDGEGMGNVAEDKEAQQHHQVCAF